MCVCVCVCVCGNGGGLQKCQDLLFIVFVCHTLRLYSRGCNAFLAVLILLVAQIVFYFSMYIFFFYV